MHDFIPNHLKQFVKIKEYTCTIGIIYTYIVRPTSNTGQIKSKKLKLDDFCYQNYPELISLIPRGFSILYDYNGNEICKLNGLIKFDSSEIDDDSEVESKMIDYSLITKWQNTNELEVVFQEKANGKYLTFILFEYQNKDYIFGGSKNMHRVYPLNDEIRENNLHDNMMKQVQIDLQIKKFPRNQTIYAEYVDGKHICFTFKPYITYFYPEEISNVHNIFPSQNTLPTDEQYHYIRNMSNTEGAVIMYKNIITGEIFRQKHKSIWYIIIRVIREQLCHTPTTQSNNSVHTKLNQVIRKRSDDFLHLSDIDLKYWYDLTKQFIYFMQKKKYTFSSLGNNSEIGMAIRWNEFVHTDWNIDTIDTNNSVQNIEYNMNNTLQNVNIISQNIQDQKIDADIKKIIDYGQILLSYNIRVCFIMRGISGSGKSFTSNSFKLQYGDDCDIFSTDNYFETPQGYQFDSNKLSEYHENNYLRFCESNAKLVCIDNTNITRYEYERYIKKAKNSGYVTLILSFPVLDINTHIKLSKHITNVSILDKQIKRYKSVKITPNYYGIFVDNYDIQEFNPFQKMPLHITCYFYSKHNIPSLLFGKLCIITVTQVNINQSGRCLLVTLEDNDYSLLYKSEMKSHITLETFDGNKPVDVGKYIRFGTNFPIHKIINGIYGPIY
jgi:hypothetical protein